MRKNLSLPILITSLLLSTSLSAHARYACELVFQSQHKAVLNLVGEDAYMQWLRWEQTANFSPFHKPTEAFSLPIVNVKKEGLRIEVDKDTPSNFVKFVDKGNGTVEWFKHPYNTNNIVPFTSTPHTATAPAYFTASRSIALGAQFRGLTIKLGTDRPHGPKGELQTKKADTADDVRSALLHTAHLKHMDVELGKDPEFLMLPEVMTVASEKSLVGYVVRDVRAMDSGHYYLPALSIPYVGREIAKLNNKSFEEFWQTNYAELLGRAKARMLLRYGLQMETPNSQNMLIQLDRNLEPTGRIFFRDISDALYVDVVAKGLGFHKEIAADIKETFDPHTYIQPYWSNSSWRFNEAGDKSVDNVTLKKWGLVHNQAYRMHLEKELGVKIPEWNDAGDQANQIYLFFGSPAGQKALQDYRAKNIQKAALANPTLSPAQL